MALKLFQIGSQSGSKNICFVMDSDAPRGPLLRPCESRRRVEHYVLRLPRDAREDGVFSQAWDASRDVTPAELEQTCAACETLAEVVSALADGDGQASRWAREKTVVVA